MRSCQFIDQKRNTPTFITIHLISLQSISEFLKNLPSHNEKNFALFNTENGIRTSSRRPSVYLPTVDIPSEQSKRSAITLIGQICHLPEISFCSFIHFQSL